MLTIAGFDMKNEYGYEQFWGATVVGAILGFLVWLFSGQTWFTGKNHTSWLAFGLASVCLLLFWGIEKGKDSGAAFLGWAVSLSLVAVGAGWLERDGIGQVFFLAELGIALVIACMHYRAQAHKADGEEERRFLLVSILGSSIGIFLVTAILPSHLGLPSFF